jgi:hypothetical protein
MKLFITQVSPPVASSSLGPNVILSTLLSQIFRLCSYVNVRKPYFSSIHNKDRIMVPCASPVLTC